MLFMPFRNKNLILFVFLFLKEFSELKILKEREAVGERE
jgi:hypothetical protein